MIDLFVCFGYPQTLMDTFRYKQVYDELLAAQHPVLICDERIDGDSLGAALTIVDLLKQSGKPQPSVFVSGEIPEVYQRLPSIDACTTDTTVLNNSLIDLVLVFDCSDGEFVKKLVDQIESHPRVINIDHHKTNPRYGHINLVCVDAPATTEIVYRLYEYARIIPSREAATCMLTGLCFDTTAFTNSATSERALHVASELGLIGARVQEVIATMFKHRSISALRVWGTALERLHHHPNYNCLITCLTQKDLQENKILDEEVDGLSNFLSLVTNTTTLYVLRETVDGHVKVSMRSSDRDVSAIARSFGGGGHEKAAGYVVKDARLLCGTNGCWRVEKK